MFKHDNSSHIITERLLLRRFTISDIDDMLDNWISDHDVQSEYGEPTYNTRNQVEILVNNWINDYEEKILYRWAIILYENNNCIGQIAFCKSYQEKKTVEVEYCLGKQFQGYGYATEALNSVIKHTFENTDYTKIEAFHRNENMKSGYVLKRVDMKATETVERFGHSCPVDKTCYAITK